MDFVFGDFLGIGLGWKGRMPEIKRQLDFQAEVVIVISVALLTSYDEVVLYCRPRSMIRGMINDVGIL